MSQYFVNIISKSKSDIESSPIQDNTTILFCLSIIVYIKLFVFLLLLDLLVKESHFTQISNS